MTLQFHDLRFNESAVSLHISGTMKIIFAILVSFIAILVWGNAKSEQSTREHVEKINLELAAEKEAAEERVRELELQQEADRKKWCDREALLTKLRQDKIKKEKAKQEANEKRVVASKREAAKKREVAKRELAKKNKEKQKLQVELHDVQRRIGLLLNEIADKDLRAKLKRQELNRKRQKTGDDYVDGKITKRIWRVRLDLLEKERIRLEHHWKNQGESLLKEAKRLKNQAVNLKVKSASLGF